MNNEKAVAFECKDLLASLEKQLENVPKANADRNLLYQLQKCRESDRPISEVCLCAISCSDYELFKYIYLIFYALD